MDWKNRLGQIPSEEGSEKKTPDSASISRLRKLVDAKANQSPEANARDALIQFQGTIADEGAWKRYGEKYGLSKEDMDTLFSSDDRLNLVTKIQFVPREALLPLDEFMFAYQEYALAKAAKRPADEAAMGLTEAALKSQLEILLEKNGSKHANLDARLLIDDVKKDIRTIVSEHMGTEYGGPSAT